MTNKEQTICEAIAGYLSEKMELGVPEVTDSDKSSSSMQYLHEQINEWFALKIVGSAYYDGIKSAFRKVHNYKLIDDPTFVQAFKKELTAQGIPNKDIREATEAIPDVIKEMKDESGVDAEQDAGFHPELEDIIKMTKMSNE